VVLEGFWRGVAVFGQILEGFSRCFGGVWEGLWSVFEGFSRGFRGGFEGENVSNKCQNTVQMELEKSRKTYIL